MNKEKIAVLTDSGSDLPEDLEELGFLDGV